MKNNKTYPVSRMSIAVSHIIMAATAHKPDMEISSAIKCWFEKCTGHIVIKLDKEEIIWKCSDCLENGIITNWQDSSDDLSEFVSEIDKSKDECKILLNENEYQVLIDSVILELNFLIFIIRALYTIDGILLSTSYDEMRFFPDVIADIVNKSSNKEKINLLNNINDKIKGAIEFKKSFKNYH